MPHRTKTWIATVTYCSELGDLDVDYGVDDLEHLHMVINKGTGYGAIVSIQVERNPLKIILVPTIEAQQREAALYEQSVTIVDVSCSADEQRGPVSDGSESVGG